MNVTLTKREREVALLIAEELTDLEIADRLSISPHTVKDHIHAVLRKTSSRTRVGIALAIQRGTP